MCYIFSKQQPEVGTMDYFRDLQFILAGNMPEHRAWYSGRVFDDYYAIQYSHAGNVTLQINNGEVEKSNSACVFLTYPGAEFAYGNPNISEYYQFHHLFVCFKGALAEQWRAGGLLRCLESNALIPILNASLFLHKFEQLIAILHSSERNRMHGRAVLLLQELLLIMTEQQTIQQSRHNPFHNQLNKLAKEINRSPELAWDFNLEAARMKISYSYFRHLFEDFCQEAPHQFLLQCRLQKAAYMLITNDLQVREIAASCGFNDEFYFSRVFKKYYGIPPLAYRKEYNIR